MYTDVHFYLPWSRTLTKRVCQRTSTYHRGMPIMSNVAEIIERIHQLPVNRLGVFGQLLDVLEEGDSPLDSSIE